MSKIICEVCGTSYPDTATQCPICGSVNQQSRQAVAGNTEQSQPTQEKEHTPVKGGRYSTANVRKRNKAMAAAGGAPVQNQKQPKKSSGGNRGLVILAIVLVVAILLMVGYICIRFFASPNKPSDETTAQTTTAETVPETTVSSVCTDLTLTDTTVVLEGEGSAWLLNVTPVPADTSDKIVYKSSDETVATVTAQGRIMAIAPGEAVITVTCGSVEKTCRVVCDFEKETEAETSEETTEETTEAESHTTLELNREDITFAAKGESWQLYSGELSKTQITWSTDDASVCTIDNGKVTAVGAGTTEVHAEFNGQKASCIIRCAFKDDEGPLAEGGFDTGIGEDNGN